MDLFFLHEMPEQQSEGEDRVAKLPKGSFIAYNRESGAEMSGKLF